MSVVDGSFDNQLTLEEHAAMSLAGGIEQMGFQCGQIWGAVLAAGARAYQVYGAGPQAETATLHASQRLVESFRGSYKCINCSDVTRLDWKKPNSNQILKFFLMGGPIRCFSMTAGYAQTAYDQINTIFGDNYVAPACVEAFYPVSCAALLAKKMGASDIHAVMAAGFAGGIGLSGGACGALGAAIWLLAVNRGRNGEVVFNSPEAAEVIDRFVESTEVNFECTEIVGRRFNSIDDHADYIRRGGCSKVIDALMRTEKR